MQCVAMIDLHSSQTMSATSRGFLSLAGITSKIIRCIFWQVSHHTRGAFQRIHLTQSGSGGLSSIMRALCSRAMTSPAHRLTRHREPPRHGEIIAAGDVLHDAVAVGVPAVDAVSEMSLGDGHALIARRPASVILIRVTSIMCTPAKMRSV
jgi:hypothetical protein